MRMSKFLKEKFDWDVDALDAWSPVLDTVIPDMVENSTFLNELKVLDGVKSKMKIPLMNADVELQAKEGCTATPDGAVIFTEEEIETTLLYMGITFCNETLNSTIAEIFNVLGVKRQNEDIPANIKEMLLAYLMHIAENKIQRLIVLGDTTSLDAELAYFDGLKKIMGGAGTNKVNVPYASITSTNAYEVAQLLVEGSPNEIWESENNVMLVTGTAEGRAIIKAWNAANPYNIVDMPKLGGTFTVELPLLGVTVMALPELSGDSEMYTIPFRLLFLGTDLLSDISFDVKYNDYTDELKAVMSFRLGLQAVWKKYFSKAVMAGS